MKLIAQVVSVWIERDGPSFHATCGLHTASDRSATRAATAAASAFLGVDGRRIELSSLTSRRMLASVKPQRAAFDPIVWLIVGCGLAGMAALVWLWWKGGGS